MRDPGGKKSLHARAQFKGMNFSYVFDDTFLTSSSSEAISDSNSKIDMSLGKLRCNTTSHSNGTCPMDVSANGDAQKGSKPGCFATKIAPVGDSVGAGGMVLYNAEGMFDMQQTFGSYNFDEACNATTEE